MGTAHLRRRGPAWLLLVAWMVAGTLVAGELRLPAPPAAASPVVRRPAGCWLVKVAAAPDRQGALVPELRRLRRHGLAAAVLRSKHWRAVRPGTRALVVPARSRAAARAARARVVDLGYVRATLHRAPRAACRR
jgi:hypothetical protein